MKLHLGLKSKVCIFLLLVGSGPVWAQDSNLPDPFAPEETLQIEDSFHQSDESTPTTKDNSNSLIDSEMEAIEKEMEMAAPPQENLPNESLGAEDYEIAEDLISPEEAGQDIIYENAAEEPKNTEVIEDSDGMVAVPNEGLVQVEEMDDVYSPYKERRKTHGAYFGVEYEPLFFSNFTSPIGDYSYREVFGDTVIPMMKVSVDYKLNAGIGAISLGAFYSVGSVAGKVESQDYTMTLSRYGFTARVALDQLTEEPYFVPYVGVIGFTDSLKYEATEASQTQDYPMAFTWIAGGMIQLDWLDSNAARESRFLGIENTFLDIFATQYASVNDENLSNTQTDILYGGGIRLEF